MEVRVLTGSALTGVLDDVARLRMTVFRDWPYLYDGDLDYERAYLQAYEHSDRSVLVGAFDGVRLVGASTGSPLTDHADDFAEAFVGQPYDVSHVFYCAESVLLSDYRGQGIGHRFFDLREAHARDLGFGYSAFCSVVRASGHPAKPASYRSLDPFWEARGYRILEGAVAQFSWKDVGEPEESRKSVQFWIRAL